MAHLRGNHGITIYHGSTGYAVCCECTNSKGRPRRLHSWSDVVEHLENTHGIICEGEESSAEEDEDDEDDYATGFTCECGWGSKGGGTEESLLAHIRGDHSVDICHGTTDYAYCQDCLTNKNRPRRFGDWCAINKHLEEVHGIMCHIQG